MNVVSRNLIQLTQYQIKEAARMLAEVFYDEPVYVYFMPDARERKNKLPQHFAIRLKHCVSSGIAHTTSPGMEGIAMWFPPDYARLTLPRILRWGAFSILPALFSRSGREAISKQIS